VQSSDLFLLLNGDRKTDGLVEMIQRAFRTCEEQNNSARVSKLFDLVSILLERKNSFAAEIPGLLFVALVAAHASGRTGEVIQDDCFQRSALLDAFREAVTAM
jgi:hypothetical protein